MTERERNWPAARLGQLAGCADHARGGRHGQE
jgi:hypothetical protein